MSSFKRGGIAVAVVAIGLLSGTSVKGQAFFFGGGNNGVGNVGFGGAGAVNGVGFSSGGFALGNGGLGTGLGYGGYNSGGYGYNYGYPAMPGYVPAYTYNNLNGLASLIGQTTNQPRGSVVAPAVRRRRR